MEIKTNRFTWEGNGLYLRYPVGTAWIFALRIRKYYDSYLAEVWYHASWVKVSGTFLSEQAAKVAGLNSPLERWGYIWK